MRTDGVNFDGTLGATAAGRSGAHGASYFPDLRLRLASNQVMSIPDALTLAHILGTVFLKPNQIGERYRVYFDIPAKLIECHDE